MRTPTPRPSRRKAAGRKALVATLVVSLMRFWYDGFVWSVRRNQV